jgi:tryptophan 2,3-dioxygenase
MDLQTRKLKAIEYLIGLRDEKMFRKIEFTIEEVRNLETVRKNARPLTAEQLVDRAKRSNNDFLSGRFKTQEELEKESEN